MNELYFYKTFKNPIKAKVIYDEEEKSISTKPIYMSNLTIMTGAAYIGLDLNLENMLILSIWGFCPKQSWKKTLLKLPENIEDGEIMLKTNRKLVSGVAIDLAKETQIYFCEDNNWICIGDKNIEEYDSSIRFMENAIMSLKDNKFKALWINPKYEKV